MSLPQEPTPSTSRQLLELHHSDDDLIIQPTTKQTETIELSSSEEDLPHPSTLFSSSTTTKKRKASEIDPPPPSPAKLKITVKGKKRQSNKTEKKKEDGGTKKRKKRKIEAWYTSDEEEQAPVASTSRATASGSGTGKSEKGKVKGKGKAKAEEEESEKEEIGSLDKEEWKTRKGPKTLPTRHMAPRVLRKGRAATREEEGEEEYDDSIPLAERPGTVTNWALKQIIDPANSEERPYLPLYDEPDSNGKYFGEKYKGRAMNNLGTGVLDLVVMGEISREQMIDRMRKDRALKIELGEEEESSNETVEPHEQATTTDEGTTSASHSTGAKLLHQLAESPSSSSIQPTGSTTSARQDGQSRALSDPPHPSIDLTRSSSPDLTSSHPPPTKPASTTTAPSALPTIDPIAAARDQEDLNSSTVYFTDPNEGERRLFELSDFVMFALKDKVIKLDTLESAWKEWAKPRFAAVGLSFAPLPFDSILGFFLPHINHQRLHPTDPIKLAILFFLECVLPDNVELMTRIKNGDGEGEFGTSKMVRFLIETFGPELAQKFIVFADDLFRLCAGKYLRNDYRKKYGCEPSTKCTPNDLHYSYASLLFQLLYGLLAKDRIKVELIVASGGWARVGAGIVTKPTSLPELNGIFPHFASNFPYPLTPPALPIHHSTVTMRTKKSSVKSILVARTVFGFAVASHSQDFSTSTPSFESNIIEESMSAKPDGGGTAPYEYLKQAYDFAKAADTDTDSPGKKSLGTEVEIETFEWVSKRCGLNAVDSFKDLWVKLGIVEEDETATGFGVYAAVEREVTTFNTPPGHGALMREAARQKTAPDTPLLFKDLPPIAQQYLEEAKVYDELDDDTSVDASWVLSTIRKRWHARDRATLLKDVPNGFAKDLPPEYARDVVDVFMSMKRDPHFHLLKWLPLFFPIERIQAFLDHKKYDRADFNKLIFVPLQETLPEGGKLVSRDKGEVLPKLPVGQKRTKPHFDSLTKYAYDEYRIAPVYPKTIFDSSLRAEGFRKLWQSQQEALGGPNYIAAAGLNWAGGLTLSEATVGNRRLAALTWGEGYLRWKEVEEGDVYEGYEKNIEKRSKELKAKFLAKTEARNKKKAEKKKEKEKGGKGVEGKEGKVTRKGKGKQVDLDDFVVDDDEEE